MHPDLQLTLFEERVWRAMVLCAQRSGRIDMARVDNVMEPGASYTARDLHNAYASLERKGYIVNDWGYRLFVWPAELFAGAPATDRV